MPTHSPRYAQACTVAWQLFTEQGYKQCSMADIATGLGWDLGECYQHLPNKDAAITGLYRHLSNEWEACLSALPEGSIGQRFTQFVFAKLALLNRHRSLLLQVVPASLSPHSRIAVLGADTIAIRARGIALCRQVIQGAKDGPDQTADCTQLARVLYALHLLIVLIWIATGPSLITVLKPVLPGICSSARAIEQFLQATFGTASVKAWTTVLQTTDLAPDLTDHSHRAEAMVARLYAHPRLTEQALQEDPDLNQTRSLQRDWLLAQDPDKAVQLVLPAFPAKAPNHQKTISKLPDLGERLALQHLQELCQDLNDLHQPGVSLTIASDGGVFADVVGVSDADVSAYGEAIRSIIEREQFHHLRCLSLKDLYSDSNAASARQALLHDFADTVDDIRAQAKQDRSLARLVDGQHRFMTEDLLGQQPELSRSAAKKRARPLAYEMVRRSRAWGRAIRLYMPDALRLSIHPQAARSDKIGVHLVPTDDPWLTPWHGCVLAGHAGFQLLHYQDAADQGAVIVTHQGQPSHCELPR